MNDKSIDLNSKRPHIGLREIEVYFRVGGSSSKEVLQNALKALGIVDFYENVPAMNGQRVYCYDRALVLANIPAIQKAVDDYKQQVKIGHIAQGQRVGGLPKQSSGGPGRLSTGVYLRLDAVDTELKAVSTLLKLIAVKVGVPIV